MIVLSDNNLVCFFSEALIKFSLIIFFIPTDSPKNSSRPYLLEFCKNNLKQFQYYYKRKFNKNIKLRYFIGFMENIESDSIYLYEYENQDILSSISHQNIKEISIMITIEEFKQKFKKNSMNYINFFPDIFEDAGRNFASENNLIKSENSYK